jgi:large subunit ribosomal protein L17
MRHRRAGRKLNRTPAHRRALFRNLVTALLEHERIRTTDPKAKEVRRLADRVITLGKRGSLHARRQALAFVCKPGVVRKLFDDVAPRFANRAGGYTRVVKLGPRLGDAAPLSLVELTEAKGGPATPAPEPKGGKPRRKRTAASAGGEAASARKAPRKPRKKAAAG